MCTIPKLKLKLRSLPDVDAQQVATTTDVCLYGGNSTRLCNHHDCPICLNRSFSGHSRHTCWSVKNRLNPRQVFKSSHKKYWFKCDQCQHEFECGLNKVSVGRWCSYCSNPPKRLCDDDNCHSCLEKSFQSHSKALCWSDKNELNPRHVFLNSNKKYWFKCNQCQHEFECALNQVVGGNWCPYCAHLKLCDNDGCQHCLDLSFKSHPKALCWSDKNHEKPRQVFLNSNNKYWFKCDVCLHNFEIQLNSIAKGNWCPFCGHKKLCDDNSCQHCLDLSFMPHSKASCWSDKNTSKPRQVFKSSGKKYWFKCDQCQHEFECGLDKVIAGNWCPFCGHKKLCDNNSCQHCLCMSFASHSKESCWLDKNELKPRQVFKSSHKKYWFKCDQCQHEFECGLDKVTAGGWCFFCHTKTETKLYDYLIVKYPTVSRQFKPDWSINLQTQHALPFDFVIEDYKLIIELDGAQHFEQVLNWDSPTETQMRDKYKMLCAWRNGYSIIRLLQEEIYENKIDLDTKLIPLIKVYEIPHVYCLYNSRQEQHNTYALFYEEYMSNPDMELDLSQVVEV
jgi:very-short-patch-repair endonuclease